MPGPQAFAGLVKCHSPIVVSQMQTEVWKERTENSVQTNADSSQEAKPVSEVNGEIMSSNQMMEVESD